MGGGREGGGEEGDGELTAGIKRLCNVAAYWRVSRRNTHTFSGNKRVGRWMGFGHPLSPVLGCADWSGGTRERERKNAVV